MRYDDQFFIGEFEKRPNRFVAWVKVNGYPWKVHVPDPGRLRELLKPGAEVALRKRDNPSRRTLFDVVGVKTGDIWVNIDSQSTNRLIDLDFDKIPFFSNYQIKSREFNFGGSRMDFLLENKKNQRLLLLEVKSVTLVEGGVAKFPDAPTLRGKRHVMELINALKEGFDSCLLFVVKRHDALWVTTNNATDPTFVNAVLDAKDAGVRLRALGCRFSMQELCIERELPVRL